METKHTKSAGGVVVNAEGKILVVNQKGLSWSLPKGHIEEGEDELTAAIREIEEESGITDLHMVKKFPEYTRTKISKDNKEDPSEMKTLVFFLFTTSQMELKPIDPENPEARWVNKEEVSGYLTHPKDKE